MTVLTIIGIIAFIGMAVSLIAYVILEGIYMLSRERKVEAFREELRNMAREASSKAFRQGLSDKGYKIHHLSEKYSYEEMLYSSRPLTLEEWFTEEEIKILKGE